TGIRAPPSTGEVPEHTPARGRDLPRPAVTAAADGKLQVVCARESNGIDHIDGPEAARDQGRTADEHAVVDATRLVVASVRGRQDAATQAGSQVLQRWFLDHGFPPRQTDAVCSVAAWRLQ